MADITSSDSVSSVIKLANNVVESKPAEGFLPMIKKIFEENKMYFYIGIAVIVLGIVLYYFYMKNKKEIKSNSKNQPKLELPTKPQVQPTEPVNTNASVPEISGDGYWVMDAQGNPVKVSGMYGNQLAPLPVPKQTPSPAEIAMLQKQMLEQQIMQQQLRQQELMQQQMMQQQMMQQQMAAQQKKPQPKKNQKIAHPEDSEDDNINSDDINVELARIKANEDENVAQHDLTNSELAEITKKLESMGNQLNGN